MKKICDWCKKEITESPFVEKKWSAIDETELYHTRCFVIAHRAQLDNAPLELFEKSPLVQRGQNRMKCLFCENEATYKITGWAEEGRDGAFVCQPVCNEHVKSYQEWADEAGEELATEPDDRIHGLEYLTGIEKVTKDTTWD